MSEHGAALQTYNQELVKCLEDLKEKRKEINNIIAAQETKKFTLEANIKTLQDKLETLNKTLSYHKALRDNFDITIKGTEEGFKKILEKSQSLLNVAQSELNKLNESTKNLSIS